MGKIFGIDLGTTYSCIATVDEYGKPVTIPNLDNSPVTPSVVFFESGGQASVGEVAKQALQSDPELVCSTIKRQMGSRDFKFYANGEEYNPETISGYILRKLAQDASEKLGEEVKDVVITCPAYFGLDEREATKKAGELAGLNVLSIINEPTAAAISYGMKNDEPQTVMVYDLGGGTFDVTIIKVEKGVIEVVATGGDHQLGGKDWDEKIQQYAKNQYVAQTGNSAADIDEDIELLGDLEFKSEQIKKQLSSRDAATMRVNGAKVELTRDQFNSLTSNLLERTIELTHFTMKEAAAKGITKYDKILLVGGSTFMPQVKDRLEREFPNTPLEFCDPNESVARGAALYGQNIAAYRFAEEEAERTGKDVEEVIADINEGNTILPPDKVVYGMGGQSAPITLVKNVVSKSYGIRMMGQPDNKEHIYNQIFRNSVLPLTHSIDAATVENNQQSVRISVFENEYPKGHTDYDIVADSDATMLIEDDLPLPDHLPAGAPISILLNVDGEGLLQLDAKDLTGGRTVHMEVKLKSEMSEEELQKSKSQSMSMTVL